VLLKLLEKLSVTSSAFRLILWLGDPSGIPALLGARRVQALILPMMSRMIDLNQSKLLATLNAILAHDVKRMARTVTRC
jgi:hypothetical protein